MKMFGAGKEISLKDFERKNQSVISRHQELVDRAVGGQRRTTLDTTTINNVTRLSWVSESERISDMMTNTCFNLDTVIDNNDETSSTQSKKKKGKTSKKEKRYDEASRVASGVLQVFPTIMNNNNVEDNDFLARYYKSHIEPFLNKLVNIDEDAKSSAVHRTSLEPAILKKQ